MSRELLFGWVPVGAEMIRYLPTLAMLFGCHGSQIYPEAPTTPDDAFSDVRITTPSLDDHLSDLSDFRVLEHRVGPARLWLHETSSRRTCVSVHSRRGADTAYAPHGWATLKPWIEVQPALRDSPIFADVQVETEGVRVDLCGSPSKLDEMFAIASSVVEGRLEGRTHVSAFEAASCLGFAPAEYAEAPQSDDDIREMLRERFSPDDTLIIVHGTYDQSASVQRFDELSDFLGPV